MSKLVIRIIHIIIYNYIFCLNISCIINLGTNAIRYIVYPIRIER